ncbi:hypothetical protein BSM4216_3868 (plasmid) [Bacillus smithii]|nr:hypothetical protein BSM4216_3868 [Bacillus smithii]
MVYMHMYEVDWEKLLEEKNTEGILAGVMAETVESMFFYLDWSTRHLKQLQKQNPATEEHHSEALFMFGIMNVSCKLLYIDPYEWCKATKIPYRGRNKTYWHLFNNKKPYDIFGKPMQKPGFYYELIGQMMGTKNEIELEQLKKELNDSN